MLSILVDIIKAYRSCGYLVDSIKTSTATCRCSYCIENRYNSLTQSSDKICASQSALGPLSGSVLRTSSSNHGTSKYSRSSCRKVAIIMRHIYIYKRHNCSNWHWMQWNLKTRYKCKYKYKSPQLLKPAASCTWLFLANDAAPGLPVTHPQNKIQP